MDAASVAGGVQQLPASVHSEHLTDEAAAAAVEKKKDTKEEKNIIEMGLVTILLHNIMCGGIKLMQVLSEDNFQNALARNMKQIENASLFFAFCINLILLFHRIDITEGNKTTRIFEQNANVCLKNRRW